MINPEIMAAKVLMAAAYALFCLPPCGAAQQPAASQAPASAPGSPADLVQQGENLARNGKLDEALALYHRALDKTPDLYEGHLATGMALDLEGNYSDAREHYTKAIELAPADSKTQAQRAMAVSYAFEGDMFKAAELELKVFNARLAKSDSVGAAELCNELGRLYLDSGDADHAEKWYKLGYNTMASKPDLTEADKNLWLFRWESAQARIAARRGKSDEAKAHSAAAKSALDKANNPEQMKFYPYLTGYVAFYTGDYKTAIAELQKADQRDPATLVLLGESYEKSGDSPQAKAYYQKTLELYFHNPANAFARPLAKKKLSGAA